MTVRDPEKVREANRRYREANREKVREVNRRYERANAEKVREKNRRYREANPEKVNAARQQYRTANPETARESRRLAMRRMYERDPESFRARARQWRRDNPEKASVKDRSRIGNPKVSETSRRYRAAHPEKISETKRRYRAAHPEKVNALQSARRARLRGARVTETVSRLAIAERDSWTCQLCGLLIDSTLPYRRSDGAFEPGYLTIDHVVALVLGGDHSYANTQAAHAVCNGRKGAKAA